jgi:hypothetical protein
MAITINNYYGDSAETIELLTTIKTQNLQIMATQAEHAQELRNIKEQNDKARAEVLAKIADLETAIVNAGNTTPEVDAALASLKESVQIDDDIVPDVP